MDVLAISHQPDAGPGVFAEAAAAHGARLTLWAPPAGEPPPAAPASYDAVMTFGGAMNAHEEDEHAWLRDEKALLRELLDRGVPLLGVCLGSQLLAEAAGGSVRRAARPEIGWFEVEVTPEGMDDPLLAPLAPRFCAFQWHSYETPLPPGAVPLARSPVCLQAYRIGSRVWGIQFHAEVSREDALHWAREYHVDPDAVAAGIEPDALAAEIDARIEAWNVAGRELCGRFLEAVQPRLTS